MKDTKIIVFNDTDEELTVRVNVKDTLPSLVKVEPSKRIVLSMRTSEIFFKIWNGNVIMFQDNRAEDRRKRKP